MDFYILKAADAAARLRFACRLAEKAYLLKHRVHLQAATAADAGQLDDLLWTFRQGSFVPHEVLASGGAPDSAVTIGHGAAAPAAADLLINLSDRMPAGSGSFARIAEVIPDVPDLMALGRTRFRAYRDGGCEPVTHDIGAGP